MIMASICPYTCWGPSVYAIRALVHLCSVLHNSGQNFRQIRVSAEKYIGAHSPMTDDRRLVIPAAWVMTDDQVDGRQGRSSDDR